MRDIRVTQYARAQEAQDMPEGNIEHAQHVCQTHTMHVEHHGTTHADMSCRADMESGAVAGEELRHSMNSERGSVVELGPVLHMAARVGVKYSAASARWDGRKIRGSDRGGPLRRGKRQVQSRIQHNTVRTQAPPEALLP